MAKIPIGAVFPIGIEGADLYRNVSTNQVYHLLDPVKFTNSPVPRSTSSGIASNVNTPTAVTLCVDGILLWLLLVWITAGTAAIVTLAVKACRER